MKCALYIGFAACMMGCQVQPNDTDSGIWYPNPKANLRLSAGNGGSSGNANVAIVGNVEQIVFVDCEGTSHSTFYNQSLESMEEESVLLLDSPALTCARELQIHASDVGDTAALVLSVTRGDFTVRLKCPAARCFPMTFTGLLEFPQPESEETRPFGLRWNVLSDSSFLQSLTTSDEYMAGACEEGTMCEEMERAVTDKAIIELLESETDFWGPVMSAE